MSELRESITSYTKNRPYFLFGGAIEKDVGRMTGSKPSCVARRLREMARDGRLERRLVYEPKRNRLVVQYRFIRLKESRSSRVLSSK